MPAVLGRIFAGGLDMLQRAGVALLGGHTVQDQEIKFGYAVTGEVDPRRVWANAGAQAGDILFLTKAIGTGVITTALKFDRAPEEAVDAAVRSMMTLNRAACDALRTLPASAVHACTDVTGFGLVGHGSEMAAASGCTLAIDVDAVPLLPDALSLVAGNVPGGGRTNAEHFAAGLVLDREIPTDLVQLLHDPQTSGGLLAAIDPGHRAAAAGRVRRRRRRRAGHRSRRRGDRREGRARLRPASRHAASALRPSRSAGPGLAPRHVEWYKLMFCVAAICGDRRGAATLPEVVCSRTCLSSGSFSSCWC